MTVDSEALAVLNSFRPEYKVATKVIPRIGTRAGQDNVCSRVASLVAQGYTEFSVVHEHPSSGKIVRVTKDGFTDYWQVLPDDIPKPVPAIILSHLGLT